MPNARIFQPSAPVRPAEAAPSDRQPSVLLRLFDIDGDGMLSADEVANSAARLWELDRNRDAELTPDELALVLAPRWEERRRAVPGVLPVQPSVAPTVPPEVPGRSAEAPRVEIYALRSLDPERTLATLQQLLRDRPEARLTIDARTRSLLAYGPGDVHAIVRKGLADLLESGLPEPFGQPPGSQPPMPGFAIGPPPRVIPLYNARARDILRTVSQIYRDRLFEPGAAPPAAPPPAEAAAGFGPPPPTATGPGPDQMVIGLGADPNSVVVTAEDELFFEVLDLIERLDSGVNQQE